MNVVRLAALLLIVPGTAQALAADGPGFAGEYVMTGKGYDDADTAYAGTCSIKEAGKAYAVSCFNSDTRHTYVGKGLAAGEVFSIFIGDALKGDHNEAFAGEYLATYRRGADGVLTGAWVHATSSAAGAETLVPAK